jgi:hypothetical protein
MYTNHLLWGEYILKLNYYFDISSLLERITLQPANLRVCSYIAISKDNTNMAATQLSEFGAMSAALLF